MDPDAAAGLPDAGPDFQQLETEGVDLSRSQFRVLEVVPQQPKQAVGGGMEEQPGTGWPGSDGSSSGGP